MKWTDPVFAGAPTGRFTHLAVLLLSAAAVSCAPPAVTVPAPVPLPKAFSANGADPLPARWWTAFDDAGLDAVIDRALRENFSLRTAWDRLAQARAAAAASGAPLWPALNGSAGASRTVQRTPLTGRTYTNQVSLGLAASYEVDLWGRIRSTHDATRLDVEARREDLRAAAISLTADIASTWYLLAEQREQSKLLGEQIQTNEKVLAIITMKFRRGQASATDVLQQRQLVESTRGERVQVASVLAVLEHLLDVLSGRRPGSGAPAGPAALPTLGAVPATGVPAEWVRRRPDVRAAEVRAAAADRRVAAAIAEQFPRLALSAGADTSAERLRDVFDNWLANLAANLTAPLFDAGLRAAEVERTRAVVSERLNAYGAAVLAGLQEVEDALTREARQVEYVESLRKQLDLSNKAVAQTLDDYTKTGRDFTRYLTTLLSHQRLERTYLTARRQRVDDRIDLCRALSTGWTLEAPDRAEVSGPRGPLKPPAEDPQKPAPPPGGAQPPQP